MASGFLKFYARQRVLLLDRERCNDDFSLTSNNSSLHSIPGGVPTSSLPRRTRMNIRESMLERNKSFAA